MTSRITIAVPLAGLAVAGALAGCGGSSGPTRAEFAKKADTECAKVNKAHPPKPNPKTPKEAAGQQAEEIKIRRDLDAKLKSLDVPDDAKKDFDAYNEGTQKILAAIDKMRADAAGKNEKQYAADSKVFAQAATDREKSAIELGFKTCGRKNPAQ
jgi:hypothetical protein